MDQNQDAVHISQVRPPLQGDFGTMTESQGSLQVPSTNAMPHGLGQGQQTEFFTSGNNVYTTLLVLVFWVFLVSMHVPDKVFRILGINTLVDHETGKLTIMGSAVIAAITVVIYFLSTYFSK